MKRFPDSADGPPAADPGLDIIDGRRNADPIEDFYTASYGRLVGILTLVAGDRGDAEEVVQEAFVRLIPRWDRVCRYEDPEAWVRTVATRLAFNRFRKARNGIRAWLRHGAPPPVPPADPTGIDIVAALAQLPHSQREVVVLHHLVGLPVAEISATLDVPLGTVKSRLSRARTALEPLLLEGASHA